jgi:hypothetical protein
MYKTTWFLIIFPKYKKWHFTSEVWMGFGVCKAESYTGSNQWRSQLDNWGREDSYIRVLHY